MKLTSEQKQQIKELDNKGYSTREICKELFGDKESRRTTVRDYLKSDEYVLSNDFSKKGVRIATLDLETAPFLAYAFNRFDVNIGQSQIVRESNILTYAVKYLNNDNIIHGSLTIEEASKGNDLRICKELHDIVNDLDVIIIQNGVKFDSKVLNVRFLKNKLGPTLPYRIIDTYVESKKSFYFPSFALDSMCSYLDIGRKIETRFELWKNYVEGSEEARENMVKYNINDVVLLEDFYNTTKAFYKNHPNLQVYSENPSKSCPICGSETFEETDKFYYTNLSKFPVYRCKDCGKLFRDRKNVLQDRDKLFVGI